MAYHFRNHKFLIFSPFLAIAAYFFYGAVMPSVSFAAVKAVEKESAPELAPPLREAAGLADYAVELLPEAIVPEAGGKAASGAGEPDREEEKFSLIKTQSVKPKDKVVTKKVFKPEVGVIEVVGSPARGGYGTLLLKDCISIAEKNNLQLQIAKKSVTLAKDRLWESRRNMLPTATFVTETYYGQVLGRRYIGKKNYFEGQQPVYHGGELFFTMKQAEANLEVVRNDYNRIRNDLVLQVNKAYYTLAKARENMSIQNDLSEEVGKMLDMVTREFDAGAASRLELLNVTSQASQVRYQLISAQGDESIAELILKQAMNLETDQKIEIEPGLEFRVIEVNFKRALQAAMVSRPEMRINSLMVDYYKFGKGIAVAKVLPKVDILGSWGLAMEEYESEDNQPTPNAAGVRTVDPDRKLQQQWYAGFKTSLPFWGSTAEYSLTREEWVPVVSAYHGTNASTSSLKIKILDKVDTYSERRLADIDYDKSRQELNKVKQDVTLEVREGCFNYEKARIQLETATSKVKYQETDLEFAKARRLMDEAADSSVIESMIKLAQEKFGYLQALADCQIAVATLNKAIGVEDYFKESR